jgi:hypothetical protein
VAEPLRHRGQRAVLRLVEHAPGSGGLALWMQHRDDDDLAAAVANDGRCIVYGPGFETLTLARQTGWVAHQVLHVALRHVQRYDALQQRTGDADLELFNLCADAIVNSALSHLDWLALPADAPRLQTLLARVLGTDITDEQALLAWDVERLYQAVDDREDQGGRRGEPRRDGPRAAAVRRLGLGQKRDLQPGAGEAPEAEAEGAREWADRLARAHAGDGQVSLLRVLLADLPRVHTPWEQVLRVQMARALSRRPGPSWSRPARSWIACQGRAGPHRRRPWEPGTATDTRAPRVVLVVDTSGSVDDALLGRFRREMQALVRRLEAALTVVVGDDAVREVLHHAPGRGRLPEIRPAQGGGTDFAPLLAEAARHRPDLAVVLTDLDGPAGPRPPMPVLWAVPPAHADAPCPFGRKLVLR